MLNQQPKVSVIIPVYNAEKYLRQCLDSVIGQTLREIEIICVDDASTDGSLAILHEYQKADSRVQVLQNDTSLKAGPSRNKGLRLAKGEYIHFLDADDYLVDDSYEQTYALAHENGADIIRTRAYDVDVQTSEVSLSQRNALTKVSKTDFNKALSFLDKPELFLKIAVVPWGGWLRRGFLLEQRIEFNDLMCVNDRSFYAQTMFAASSIILADIFLVYHRINNPDSLVGKRAQYFDCHFESYRLIEEYSRDLPSEVRRMCLDNEMYDICHWLGLYSCGRYKDRIADSTEAFLRELDTSLWSSVQNTRWYIKMSNAIRQIREMRAPYMDGCDDPKVSVIMPVYNSRQFLDEAIRSVLTQSMADIELICVDDGSTDDSMDILRRYAADDKRLIIIRQEHEFAGVARNKGIDAARGKYVTFLDSDDIMLPDALQDLCQAIETEHADIAISKAHRFFDDPQKSYPASWVYNDNVIAETGDAISLQTCPRYLFQISTAEPWAKIFRRDFIMQNQVQFAPLQRSEDICFVYYAYSVANKIALCEKETVLYRKNTDGLEANKDKLPTEPCQAWLLLCEKLKARDLFDRVKQSFVNAAVNGFMYNISQFATGEAFAQCYSEFVGRVVPALDINLADAGYFYNRQHYDYLKELVDDGSCLNHLHKYYKLYTGLQKRGNSQKVEKKVENRGTQNKHEQSKCDCIGCFITFIPRKIRGGGDAIASTACGTHGTVCCSISASRSDRELRKKVRTETEIYQTKFKLEETGHGRENQGIGHYSGI